jgi:hypothetical protein
VQVEKDDIKKCTGKIEKWVEEVFKTDSLTMQRKEIYK